MTDDLEKSMTNTTITRPLVGAILRASWGYDQTNIDYYQVTKLIGKTMVEIRKIAQCAKEDAGWMCGHTTPVPDAFIGEPTRHKVNNGAVKVRSFGVWAHPCRQDSVDYWSSYA